MADSRPDVLYLVHRVPYPPDKGDRIRNYHVLRYLARRAQVSLACLTDEPVPEKSLSALAQLCARVAVVPLGKRTRWLHAVGSLIRGRTISEGAFQAGELERTLRSWARQVLFHASLASASSVAPYLRLSELRDVPAVIDLIDVDSQKWFDYASADRGLRGWLYRTEGRRLRRLEQSLSSWTRAVTLVSEAEASLFRQFCAWPHVHAITNGVDLDYFQPMNPTGAAKGCVFVGALDYRPNVDAACWFSQEVWPHVRRRHPTASLSLVGREPVREVLRLAAIEGVTVVGQVPDVRPHVAQAAVAVAPLQIARGLQNKVLEAMAMARPVVASPQALAALTDRPGLPALPAASAQEWVDHLGGLLDDADRRRRLGRAGRAYVEAHHHWDKCLEPLGDLLGLAGDRQPAPVTIQSRGPALPAVSGSISP
jgi:sugar transferase (PEP-CTERM/EpsH1 system associated)